MIEIQYSSTALILLINPRIPHQNNGTASPSYMKRRYFVVSYVQPVIQQYKSATASATEVVPMKIMDDFHYKCKPSRAYPKINNFHGE